MMPQPQLSQQMKDQIFTLSKNGMKFRDIAKKLGISYGSVQNHASKLDVKQSRYSKTQHDEFLKQCHALASQGKTKEGIAKKLGISKTYVFNLLKTHSMPTPESTVELPKPFQRNYTFYSVAQPGEWLILSDVHVPYHDEITLQHAIREAKERNVVGVILNGDFLDCHELSKHDKDGSAPRYADEVKAGIAVLKWIRSQLPNAKIIYKVGNHEERLDKYILGRAPALFDLEFATVESLLHFRDYDIQCVKDKRPIMLGKLHLLHGHEYLGGGGVNPARWIYLKAQSVTMVGHFHRTSEHHSRNIANKSEAAWSVGCACSLTPAYAPLNNWNHGYAFVSFSRNGDFDVINRRVIHGRVA